jgi:S1/P1 nuclease
MNGEMPVNRFLKPKSAIRLTVLLCLFLLVNQGLAWGPAGHMIVAHIAYERLNSHAKAEVDRLIALKINPEDITANSLDFVNASHWPDDLRPVKSFADTLPLHFADFPFSPDETELPDLPDADNVITALKHYVEVLKSDAPDAQRAEALRFIVHFVGDIHQPLHCSTRVTEQNPDGDRGGNLFMVRLIGPNGKVKKVKLHSYWDGGIDTFPKAGPNFAPPPLEEIDPVAARVTKEFPDTDPKWKAGGPFDFEGWAKESSDLAESVAYHGLMPNGVPSKAYKAKAIKTVDKRVAWGGYRLAALLNAIWPEE